LSLLEIVYWRLLIGGRLVPTYWAGTR
jgi:hypothetical protein